MKRDDSQLMLDSYTTERGVAEEGDISDINSVFRIDLYNGNSTPIMMTRAIVQDMRGLDGPNVGAVTTWMGEEYMYIKLNKPN